MMLSLTSEQEEAVTSDPMNHLTVYAGPGTGKTTVLTLRARWLGMRFGPERVVCLSFTVAAAEELAERLADLGMGSIRCSTLHAWAVTLLERGVPEFVRRTIYDEADARAVMGMLPRRLPDNLRVALYRTRLRQAHATDYDMLIDDLLANIGMLHRRGWLPRFVLVDEAQDLDQTMHRVLDALRGVGVQVTTVGDHRQAIYRWRDARPDLWIAHGHTVTLTIGQRCTSEIMHYASRFTPDGAPQITSRTSGPPVTWLGTELGPAELGPAETVRTFREAATGSVAILARTWWQARRLADELGTDARWYGDTGSAWDGVGVEVARWIRAVVHRTDDNLAQLVVAWWAGRTEAEQVRQQAPPGEVLTYASQAGLIPALPTPSTRTLDLIDPIADRVPDWIRTALDDPHLRTVPGFGSWWTWRRTSRPVVDTTTNQVHVMTIHAAKGLEFDSVLAVYPSRTGWPSREVEEDERSCRYVACTRARSLLWIANPPR